MKFFLKEKIEQVLALLELEEKNREEQNSSMGEGCFAEIGDSFLIGCYFAYKQSLAYYEAIRELAKQKKSNT